MSEAEGVSVEQFAGMVERAGLTLTAEEIKALKPMYDHYAKQVKTLFEVDLGADDPAVMYSPIWDPQS